ncbi:UNVERIFIED_ORG: hypothetical protein J2W82_000193 [Pseudomonas mohnii]|nr:hypothetical protein [Pseudomonas mohnii]
MNTPDLIKEFEKNISYQFEKIEALYMEREKTNIKYLNELLHPTQEIDQRNAVLNQAYSDALLNSMASLVDYYCILCMLKIGVPESKIRKIQYRSFNNKFLIEKNKLSEVDKKNATIDKLRTIFDAEISKIPEPKTINSREYWMGFLGKAISSSLNEYGANVSEFQLSYDASEDRLDIDLKIKKYFSYMYPLFCNICNSSGVKLNIYIDINNLLKHNAVPYLTTHIEQFQEERRIFSYFEIKNKHHTLLKDGILKDIVAADFESLKSNIDSKYSNITDYSFLCELEKVWGLGRILTLDPKNSHISQDNKTLYIFVDNVLIAKNSEATLIDAGDSLLMALRVLKREIDRGLNYDHFD